IRRNPKRGERGPDFVGRSRCRAGVICAEECQGRVADGTGSLTREWTGEGNLSSTILMEDNVDRRTFIGITAAFAVTSRFSWAASEHRIEKIGLELYTVRYLLKKDFEGTLAKVAKIGYKEVEFAGYLNDLPNLNPPPKRVRE